MKLIADYGTVKRATNCGGPMESFQVKRWQIEDQDVRTVHSDHNGYKNGKYVIRESDVGRAIEEVTQPGGYRCWYFVNKE